LKQTVTDPYFVATELLGSADGSVIQLSSAGGTGAAPRPAVRLTLQDGSNAGGQVITAVVPSENTAEITFNLVGAVFGQNVGSGTLDLRNVSDDATASGLVTDVIRGGKEGDSSVTFMVEVTATQGINKNHRISFWVPDLRVSPAIIGTTMPPNPRPVTGVAITASLVGRSAVKGATPGQVPFPMVTGGLDTPMVGTTAPTNNYLNRWVVGTGQVVGISMGSPVAPPNVAEVALKNRKVFAISNANYTPMGSTSATRSLRLGTLTVSINSVSSGNTIYTLDPSDPAVEIDGGDRKLDSSLAGNIDVVVKGAFKTNDMVRYGTRRTAAKIADGMAMVKVPITSAASSSTEFMYVPGGVDDLRPGDITVVAMRNFTRSGNNPGRAAMSMGTIKYAGVNVEAYAHGVVKGGGTDISYLRVRCTKATTGCAVFLDCQDQDGKNYFEEAGIIPAGSTIVWSSDDVAGVLGGGWSKGRGACDLMSDGALDVQHMVRSGQTLVNNSAVVGRSLGLNEGQLNGIDKALADICSSLPGHLGREADADGADDDLTTVNDNVSAVVETMCNNRLAGGEEVGNDVDANGPAPGL